jgi:hypothetical protein
MSLTVDRKRLDLRVRFPARSINSATSLDPIPSNLTLARLKSRIHKHNRWQDMRNSAAFINNHPVLSCYIFNGCNEDGLERSVIRCSSLCFS